MIRFGYADTSFGQIHYAEAGAGPTLLCLHQTPRSWDEYRELIPLLAPSARVIAMDTLGMGRSAPPPGEASIEVYAQGAAALLEALGVDRADVMGHHTGGVIAVELAASRPDMVRRLVLTSTAWVDAASRERRTSRPAIDHAETMADGSHLMTLWNRRRQWYPPDRPDVLERYIRDLIDARDPEEGHLAVGRYRMEDHIGLIDAPTLVVGASADPYAFGELEPVASRIAGATTAVVEGGTVGLLEDKAAELAELVQRFLVGGKDELDAQGEMP